MASNGSKGLLVNSALHTLQVRDVVEGVDREEWDVRDVDDLERVVLVVQDDGRVVRLLLGGRVVRRLERAPNELLKREGKRREKRCEL